MVHVVGIELVVGREYTISDMRHMGRPCDTRAPHDCDQVGVWVAELPRPHPELFVCSRAFAPRSRSIEDWLQRATDYEEPRRIIMEPA